MYVHIIPLNFAVVYIHSHVHVRLFIDTIQTCLFRPLYAGGYNCADALMKHLHIGITGYYLHLGYK